MNIFRLAGDVSHLVAIIILLLKIWRSKSCAGRLTLATQCGCCAIISVHLGCYDFSSALKMYACGCGVQKQL